ncbi:MAG: hypothetical protein ACYC1C_06015 [Chloroflexota bacterium]
MRWPTLMRWAPRLGAILLAAFIPFQAFAVGGAPAPTDGQGAGSAAAPSTVGLLAVGDYRVYLPLVMNNPEPTPSWVTIVTEGFEGSFPGANWVVGDDNGTSYGEYYWGKRNCRASSGSYSGWAVGGGTDGSALACDSNYPNMANSWMVYGPFSLAGATAADFSFNLWQNIPVEEGSYRDRLSWLASVDGTYFYGWSQVGATSGWEAQTFDLTTVPTLGNVTGQPQVWVALRFYSNETGNSGYGRHRPSQVDDGDQQCCDGGGWPGDERWPCRGLRGVRKGAELGAQVTMGGPMGPVQGGGQCTGP